MNRTADIRILQPTRWLVFTDTQLRLGLRIFRYFQVFQVFLGSLGIFDFTLKPGVQQSKSVRKVKYSRNQCLVVEIYVKLSLIQAARSFILKHAQRENSWQNYSNTSKSVQKNLKPRHDPQLTTTIETSEVDPYKSIRKIYRRRVCQIT